VEFLFPTKPSNRGSNKLAEHYWLPACPFGSLPKSSWNIRSREFSRAVEVVGKLPTTTGWQPVLPETDAPDLLLVRHA
jgi:hypothetical protein